ncbi:MAG: YhbY family RNA-binding protein [Candidatus Altiarchaeota archaeon]
MKKEIQTINIGKKGITDSLIDEIKSRLEKQKILKIKILKSARENLSREEIAKEVANKVNAKKFRVIGNTFILEKE